MKWCNEILGQARRRQERGLNQRRIGTDAEQRAAAFLQKQGMEILEQNFRSRRGEIDIVGMHNGYLTFVEVKYRNGTGKGSPEAAVGDAKQRTICRVADYYRCVHGIRQSVPIRYDVVAIQKEQIRWYQNAFPHR